MKKLTIMVIPDGTSKNTKQYRFPSLLIKFGFLCGLALSTASGFLLLDYLELRAIRSDFNYLANENEGLKGEARLLMQNLDDVKLSLRRVQDYTSKLGELTAGKVNTVSEKTGIGPLSKEEFDQASLQVVGLRPESDYVPLGVKMDKLVFRPVFDRLGAIGKTANKHAVELQHLLSELSQQKTMLSSVPTVKPVDGWITSSFGSRVSPFTGEKSQHRGIDVAAAVGTPIHAPADGVVIFTGAKAGFGNFIMIAHGYGVVSRYGHNHQNMVQVGQRVKRGEQIGTVGMTGRTTGPHLHYEIWVNGRVENPKKFILDDFSIY